MSANYDVAVIGGGVAGLTAAALLAHDGARVVVFEHHNVPGGCASFYQRGGYRFDVGATVVNGFGARGVHRRIFERLGIELDARPLDPAMMVHLGETSIARYGDARWIDERLRVFGPQAERFWKRQERLADRAWDFASRLPCLPVDLRSVAHLAKIFRPQHVALLRLQGKPLASLLPADASPQLRAFVDLQLLITAQADSATTDASFGVTALDIAREGTYHLRGGIAGIAIALARGVRRSGGEIRYNSTVTAIRAHRDNVTIDAGNASVTARYAIAAIPYENVRALAGKGAPPSSSPSQRWSAVVAYVGVPPGELPDDIVLHHQILHDVALALGEANSAFVSISEAGDTRCARNGGRAITISTHTDPAIWERAYRDGTYEQLRERYGARLRAALERAAGRAVKTDVFEVATPHTFERYTARSRGMVGGVPQTTRFANLRARSQHTGLPNVLLCGDTAFPGQSTVGVTLSAINAVRSLGFSV